MSEIDTASEDWSARATSTIVGYVDTVRGTTTGKAMVASRLAVYGIAAGLVAVVMLLIGLVLLVRFLVVLSDTFGITSDGEVWSAYWFLGVIFLVLGGIMWRKRGK